MKLFMVYGKLFMEEMVHYQRQVIVPVTSGLLKYHSMYSIEILVQLNRGVSLLLAIQFRAVNDSSERDPLTVTIEGINQTASALTFGSSWPLIYNDSTGFSPDPGRYTDGIIQYIPTNVIWYASYRFLFTSKRSTASSVQVGGITMLEY
jgi:hypothetical protein